MGFDETLFEFINGFSHVSVLLDGFFIFLADYLVYLVIAFFVVLLFLVRGWRQRMYFFSLGALSTAVSWGVVSFVLKSITDRPRPFVALDITPLIEHGLFDSFPSGHVAFLLPLALTIFYIHRTFGIWTIVGVGLVGIARVITGVHWPTDILGAAVIAAVVFYAVRYLLLKQGYSNILHLSKSHRNSDSG